LAVLLLIAAVSAATGLLLASATTLQTLHGHAACHGHAADEVLHVAGSAADKVPAPIACLETLRCVGDAHSGKPSLAT
jgi:hypothetical protein